MRTTFQHKLNFHIIIAKRQSEDCMLFVCSESKFGVYPWKLSLVDI
jgi:hypothetical protein